MLAPRKLAIAAALFLALGGTAGAQYYGPTFDQRFDMMLQMQQQRMWAQYQYQQQMLQYYPPSVVFGVPPGVTTEDILRRNRELQGIYDRHNRNWSLRFRGY